MEKVYSNRGITIVSLIMTVVILIILSTVTVYTLKSSKNAAPYNKMIADITLLEEKLLVYYNKYNTIPTVSGTEETIDGVEYSKINLGELEGLTLNYGSEKETGDYYLVNDNLKVYYKKGMSKSGDTIHIK